MRDFEDSALRGEAYRIIGRLFDNPAPFWHTVKLPVLAQEDMTLDQMEGREALWVAKGIWQHVFLRRDTGRFYTAHKGYGPSDYERDYEEMWRDHAE